jgi:hypothetical protein
MDVRCPSCNKKLAEVNHRLGQTFYECIKANMTFTNDRVYQECACGERYEIREVGAGYALIGSKGSKIFE